MKPITLKLTILKSILARAWKTIQKLTSARTWEPILKLTLAFILKHIKLAAALAIIIIATTIGALVFYNRLPVLVLTDISFIELYGKERLRRQGIAASFALFRRVKPVITADSASPDIQVAAISGAARNPYCVLFPAYLAGAAEHYHLQFPGIPAAILIGYRASSDFPQPDGVLCVYRTDLETDLYRAGLLAGMIGLKKGPPDAQRTCFLWQDRYIQTPERESFSRGLSESDSRAVARFTNSASDLPGPEAVSCMILTRSGAEYLDKNTKTPLILFTWLDPLMLPAQTVAAFDDSTWALVIPAARMAVSSQAEGKIPSKPLLFSGEKADNGIGQILRQLAKKKP
jgi:hypothetical protein